MTLRHKQSLTQGDFFIFMKKHDFGGQKLNPNVCSENMRKLAKFPHVDFLYPCQRQKRKKRSTSRYASDEKRTVRGPV